MKRKRSSFIGSAVALKGMEKDHHDISELLSAIEDALTRRHAPEIAGELSLRLSALLQAHHDSEELLMRLYGYPHLTKHAHAHQHKYDSVAQLHEAISNGDVDAAQRCLRLLIRTLAMHDDEEDDPLKAYLHACVSYPAR